MKKVSKQKQTTYIAFSSDAGQPIYKGTLHVTVELKSDGKTQTALTTYREVSLPFDTTLETPLHHARNVIDSWVETYKPIQFTWNPDTVLGFSKNFIKKNKKSYSIL